MSKGNTNKNTARYAEKNPKRSAHPNGGKKKKFILVLIAKVLLIAEAACIAILAIYLAGLDILPTKYFIPIFVLLAALVVVQAVLVFRKGYHKKARYITSIVVSCILIVISLFAFFFLQTLYSHIEKMNQAATAITSVAEESEDKVVAKMNIYVLDDSEYQELSDLKGKTFGVLDLMDQKNTALAVVQIGEELGEELTLKKSNGVLGLTNSLRDGEVDAIILNEGYVSVIEDNDETFKDWARLLCTYEVKGGLVDMDILDTAQAAEASSGTVTAKPVEDVSVDPFIIYISGMDTRGDEIVSDIGNSDVNILVVVNPNTHKILLLNVPRDYYYYLYGDENYPDKLTHTGCYGIDCGITTLNSLFDIQINNYIKVGFNSVINIVNALGGIDVDSEYEFEIEGHYFTQGINHVDGENALFFSRERHSLPGGDRQRGRNQQAVITAIINKMTSPEVLANFNEVLNAISSNVVTDISPESINQLVKLQLETNASWDIQKTAVDGTGSWEYCYTLGTENDVMLPDWDTVAQAKADMTAIMNGE